MSLDERWIPLLPRLSRLELLVVTRLAAHGGELAVTVSDLAGQLGAHPKNLGGTLRELNGRLVQYCSSWGHRPVARLRLLDPELDRVAEVRDWLGQRERAAVRPLEESRDCSMPGLPKIAAAVLLEESRDGAIPGLLKSDSLLGS